MSPTQGDVDIGLGITVYGKKWKKKKKTKNTM
jgi:hypothetical protein